MKLKMLKYDTMLKYLFFMLMVLTECAQAHHFLGRPSYSLNEDSNTPPSMVVETQIGNYFVTCMIFPAFPRPNEQGRVHVYASRLDNGKVFDGKITFTARDDNWIGNKHQETLGTQPLDGNVFRQGFIFMENGDYIITAYFESDGEPYIIDIPLRIGDPAWIGPIGITVIVIITVLIAVNLIRRKRLLRAKIRESRSTE
jgi:hypothetical protein